MKRKDFLKGFVGVSIGFSSGCLNAIGLASDEEINDTYVDGYDIFQKAENPANDARPDLYKSAAATFTDAYRVSQEEFEGRYDDIASDAAWNAATKANLIETRRLFAPPVLNELVIETTDGDSIALPDPPPAIMPSIYTLERQRPVLSPDEAKNESRKGEQKYHNTSTDYLELNYVDSKEALQEALSTDDISPGDKAYPESDPRSVEDLIIDRYSLLLEGYRVFDSQYNSGLVSLEYGDTLLGESEVDSSKLTLPHIWTSSRPAIQRLAYEAEYPLITAFAMELANFDEACTSLVNSTIDSIDSDGQTGEEYQSIAESIPIPTVSLMMNILDVEKRPPSVIRYIRSPSDETRDLPIDSIGGYTEMER